MIHANVYEANAHALALLHDHRRAIGASPAVEGEPVELHRKRVGHGVIRQQRPLLKNQPEVAVDPRFVSLLGMDDEHPQHAHHLLHGEMRMVEKRAVLVQGPFVNKLAARRHRILPQPHAAVHLHRHLETMPMDRRHLGQFVLEDHPYAIALVHL